MDLSAIIDEFNRRKAQAGQGVANTLGLQKKPADWFQQMQQGQNAVVTGQQRDNINRELADMVERFTAGVVPQMIRERDRAMQTDPSAAAKPFTSEEIKQATPFVTAAAPIAFHGTPHTFDKFDASKIGTGEGAQSYGHGLYFAENPAVAQEYQRLIPQVKNIESILVQKHGIPRDIAGWLHTYTDPSKPIKSTADILENLKFLKPDATEQQLTKWIDTARGVGKEINQGGNMYQVNIPDQHAAKMLDWDKPLSEQPEIVQKLKPLADRFPLLRDSLQDFELKNTTGGTIHSILARDLPNKANVSDLLQSAGIPGIKYLDQGSRTAGQGTHNFVVFDPAILEDVTRK